MVTKLQDIANQVAMEDVSSNSRLRNEEIRKRMYGDWQEPVEPVAQETPGGLVDSTKQDTLAKTYSALKSNFDTINRSSNNALNDRTDYSESTPIELPKWAPTAVGMGMSLGGLGKYAGLGSAATQLVQGNRAGAAGTLASIFANSKVPGLGAIAGPLVGGLVGDASKEDIGRGVFNSGLGYLVGAANPLAGLAYSIARNFGFNPAQGLGELFGMYDQRPANFEGGFFGTRSDYNTPTSTYGTGPTNVGGQYSTLTGNEGFGPSTGGYSGLGIGNPSSYGGGTSYGGYSPTMNYSSNSSNYWSGDSSPSDSGD